MLLRQIETRWPPTGLRPRANSSSLIDLLAVSSFPSMAPSARNRMIGFCNSDLHDAFAVLGGDLIVEALAKIESLTPVPQPSSYHFQLAPVPRLPPATLNVTLPPMQIPFTGALLLVVLSEQRARLGAALVSSRFRSGC